MENEMKQPWQLVQEIELIYRSKVKLSERPIITNSSDIANLLRNLWNPDKIEFVEQFKVLLLNRANKFLGIIDLSTGSVTGTVADPKLILASAIKANAVSIVITHNQPSGSLKPSRADEDLTYKIKEAAKFLDMRLLDHIIISSEGYYSFADEGLL